MQKEIQYTSVRNVISKVLRHPLLQDVNLEDCIQYVLDFIELFSLPNLYTNKEIVLKVKDYRVLMPCDLISINQVKDNKSNLCLSAMTDTFNPTQDRGYQFKTQGRVLFTSFKEGEITLSYKAIPVDEEGFPLVPDNRICLMCLEQYIKKEFFTIKFDVGEINSQVLNHTETDYYRLAGQLESEFNMPSISEMESLKNSYCTLLQRTNEFSRHFKTLGDQEFIRRY